MSKLERWGYNALVVFTYVSLFFVNFNRHGFFKKDLFLSIFLTCFWIAICEIKFRVTKWR